MAGISVATYYTWRKKFVGMARPQLPGLKALEKDEVPLAKGFGFDVSFSADFPTRSRGDRL